MEIYVYKGEWDLASIDFDCLRVLAFIKFAEISNQVENPIEIITNSNPMNSPNGLLPYLRDGKKKLAGYERIVDYLKKHKKYTLPEPANSTSEAYMSYLYDQIYPFFKYMQWGDPQNLEETRMLYSKRIPFPFNFYYPRKYVRKVNELTQVLASFNIDDPIDTHDIATMDAKARKCINWMAEKLSSDEWKNRIENQITEFDATMYAYLAIILKQKLPHSQLYNHANLCENLIKFVDGTTKKYFKASERFETPNPNLRKKSSDEKNEEKIYTGVQEDDDPKDIQKRYILSGLVAFFAMSGYAVLAGIFRFGNQSRLDDDQNYTVYEDDED